MNITIKNCNNIDDGKLEIKQNALNIKYAINGTGKSSIAKAIDAFVKNDDKKKKALIPFKHKLNTTAHEISLDGLDGVSSVEIFNDDYVQSYVYQPNELLKNSFEIFVKTKDYDERLHEIEELLKDINKTFLDLPELELLINTFNEFIVGFGKAKGGYSATSSIGKGIGKGNILNNIPINLKEYSPYIKDKNNVKWLKWQHEGSSYLELAEQCPYCTNDIKSKKDKVLEVAKVYDPKTVQELNKMLEVFETLLPYFSTKTQEKIKEITENVSGINDTQKDYLKEIRAQVENLNSKLIKIKSINFHSLKTVDKISDELKQYLIDISYFSHLETELTSEKITIINATLYTVLEKAGVLQGEVARQRNLIKTTIETNKNEINSFLYFAGYKYTVDIIEDVDNKTEYRLVLKHADAEDTVSEVKQHLSFGEKNAFALVLFMYNVLKENPNLIILDDPISSFDGNKKFAIINMLFMSKHCFRNKTVLLLTHEFNTIIDVIYNMPQNFQPAPKASFLTNQNGILSEKTIEKKDILSFIEIAKTCINSEIDNLNKLIYLRRLLEITSKNGLEWELLSNIFHKREEPIIRKITEDKSGKNQIEETPMTSDEILKATNSIKEYISNFNYQLEYVKTQDLLTMIGLYDGSCSNYEKLQIYRIIIDDNNANKVIRKYVNETFHIENDYLFQLNPMEYNTIAPYIIDECNKDIDALRTPTV